MRLLSWSERWPLQAMLVGATAGAIGMVGGQVSQGANLGAIMFTSVLAIVFVGLIAAVIRSTELRLARRGVARAPSVQPWGMIRNGLWFITVMMWLLSAFGLYLVVVSPRPEHRWHMLAYVGVAVCAMGAAVLVGRMRREFDEQYRRPDEDEDLVQPDV